MGQEPESFCEQLSRVEQMIADDGDTWDLSPNDKAALSALLKGYRLAMELVTVHANADESVVKELRVRRG